MRSSVDLSGASLYGRTKSGRKIGDLGSSCNGAVHAALFVSLCEAFFLSSSSSRPFGMAQDRLCVSPFFSAHPCELDPGSSRPSHGPRPRMMRKQKPLSYIISLCQPSSRLFQIIDKNRCCRRARAALATDRPAAGMRPQKNSA